MDTQPKQTKIAPLALLLAFMLAAGAMGLKTAVDSPDTAVHAAEPTGGLTPVAYLPMVHRGFPPYPYCFKESGGYVVAEMEEIPPVSDWRLESDIEGYTGDGYMVWRGPDNHTPPGNEPPDDQNPNPLILRYDIMIQTPGDYNVRIHSLTNGPAPDLENDVFTRMDSGAWQKTLSWWPYTVWTWRTTYENNILPHFVLTPGLHTFEIARRSHGFKMNRVTFYLDGAADGLDLDTPTSPNCYD